MRKNLLRLLSRHHLLAVAAMAVIPLASCDWMQVKDHHEEVHARFAAAKAKRLQRACASNSSYDRLKDFAFNQAIKIRNTDAANLDRLATYSVIRMENPQVKTRDDKLDVTVCQGRFVLYLPQGAERWFGGETSLEADVEYTAQMAADGSGLIYQVRGADPIIYRLAAFDLQGHKYVPPPEEVERFAQAHAAAPAVPPAQQAAQPIQPAAAAPAQNPAPTLATAPAKAPSTQPAVAPTVAVPAAKPSSPVVQAAAAPAAKQPAAKPIPAAVMPPAKSPAHAKGASAPKHPVQMAQASPARPLEPKSRKEVVNHKANPPRPSRGEEQAMAAAPLERGGRHTVQMARAEPRRWSKPDRHGSEKQKPAPVPAAAHAPPVRPKQALAPSTPLATKKPVQIVRAAVPRLSQPLVRRVSQTSLGLPPAPPKAKVAVAPPKPSLLARLPGLAALFAAPQPAARKAAPAAAARPPAPAPARVAPPPRDGSIAASRSTKLADQTAGNAALRPGLQARPSIPIASRDDCVYARSRGEEMLCGNGRLASLDRSVQRLYDAALGSADGQARYQLQRTRQRFLAYLDSCRSEACLARVYQVRMNEIRDIMAQE